MKTQRFPALSRTGFLQTFFCTPQPRKLRVERSDRSNCAFLCPRFSGRRGRRWHQGAAGTMVATGDFTAARSQAPQLLRCFVEENPRVACQLCASWDTRPD
jgi:hypothetical protein